MKKIKWLLVGPGDIANKRVVPAINNNPCSELTAVCGTNPERTKPFAEQHGIPAWFVDYDRALAESDVDAVYLATPVNLHPQQALSALANSKHVLVEKPLGLNAPACRELVAAAQTSDKTSACAYYRRTYPRFRHLKEMLNSGEFGIVTQVRLTYFTWFDPERGDPKAWRVRNACSGGGALADMGSHMFDLIIDLFGMPATVFAKKANLVHKHWDVEDTLSSIITYPNGMQVIAGIGWNSKTWRHEMEVVGSEAKIYWCPFDAGPVVKTVGRYIEELPMTNDENVHQPLVNDFVSAITSGSPPLCPLGEAVKTNQVMDAIYESARSGKEITLS